MHRRGWQGTGTGDFWMGWDQSTTWLVVIGKVSLGLLISRVMKHFDSIIKIFCVACSNLVVYLCMVLLFDQPLRGSSLWPLSWSPCLATSTPRPLRADPGVLPPPSPTPT